MRKYRLYRQRFPFIILGAVVFAVISYTIAKNSNTQTAQWFSGFLVSLSAAFVAAAIVGTLLIELLPLLANDDTVYLEEGQYNLTKEIEAIRREIAKVQNQNDTITKELEGIESQITNLEDTISDR